MTRSTDLMNSEGAVCPHCQHVNMPLDENWRLYDENISEFECSDCGKEFELTAYATWFWVSEPAEEEEGA